MPFKIILLTWLICFSSSTSALEANYFEQFKFSIQGSCENIYTLYFITTSAIEFAELGKSENGERRFASLSLQLFDKQNYWAKYSEHEAGRLTYMEIVQGKWSVESDTITLSNLGSGVPDRYKINDQKTVDAIRFRFNRVLNDPGILKSSMNLVLALTNIGPKGKSAGQYCHGL